MGAGWSSPLSRSTGTSFVLVKWCFYRVTVGAALGLQGLALFAGRRWGQSEAMCKCRTAPLVSRTRSQGELGVLAPALDGKRERTLAWAPGAVGGSSRPQAGRGPSWDVFLLPAPPSLSHSALHPALRV